METTTEQDTSATSKLEEWLELQKQQHDLYANLLKRNEELERSLKVAQNDILAFRTAVGTLNEQKESVLQTNSALQSKLSNITEDGHFAVALIDGDGYVFAPHYVSSGRTGGQSVAQIMIAELSNDLARRIPILVFICLNRLGLSEVLASKGLLGNEPNLDEFIVGLNQSTPLLSIIDVGSGKEAADAKIRDMLRLYSRLHQVQKVYFGGAHDGGYARDLTSLRTEGLLNKICLLDGNSQKSVEIERLNLPRVGLGDLFHSPGLNTSQYNNMPNHRRTISNGNQYLGKGQSPRADALKLALSPPPSTSKLPTSFSHYESSNSNQYDPKNPTARHTLTIKGSKSIKRQTPPLCNTYYVSPKGCYRGDKCTFAHNYRLTEAQVDQYRVELQNTDCKLRNQPGHGIDNCLFKHLNRQAVFVPTTSLSADYDVTRGSSQDDGQDVPMVTLSEVTTNAGTSPAINSINLLDSPSGGKGVGTSTLFSADIFEPLLRVVEQVTLETGDRAVRRSEVALKLLETSPQLFRDTEIGTFKEYTKLAVQQGLVVAYGTDRIGVP